MDKELMFSENTEICLLIRKSATATEKWEAIGRGLGMNGESLAFISQKYKGVDRCLFAMITAWLSRKEVSQSGSKRNVTLRTLVTVLRSEEVGEGDLAEEITKEKGGKSLTRTRYTPRVVKPTTVKPEKKPAKATKEKTLSLPDPILESYLRVFYSKASQHQKDEWPPSFNVKFIDLILVQQNKMPLARSRAEEKVRLITQGETAQLTGKRLSLNKIMMPDHKVVLINGAPGVGKTRIALQLRREWAAGNLLTSIRLVLYIPLRDPVARLSENIDELLKYFGRNYNDGDTELIKKDQGKGILFILDGWDELRPSCREEQRFFPSLINGRTLPGCSVIVTSRPGLSNEIINHADSVIEIIGFSQPQVKEYIRTYFSEDEEGSSKLINDLENYPNIASTCYVAINLAIVCYVYHALGFKLPQTLTEVYQWFIIHTVLRHLKRKRSIEDIQEDLPYIDSVDDFFSSTGFDESVKTTFGESIIETLQHLGELALKGLKNDDLCFSRKLLVETCRIDEKDFQFDGFGLLKPMQVSLNARVEPYYHFLHLSIQEFIAAFCISRMDAGNAAKWLVHDGRYDAVIKFFCGLDQFKSQALRVIVKSSHVLLMFHLECIYEGQWKDYCSEIARRCSNSFTVDRNLPPRQWEALAYVMANSKTQWHLECSQVLLDTRELVCFNRHLSNNAAAVSNLCLHKVNIEYNTYIHLAKTCQTQVALKELSLCYCYMSSEGLLTIFSALKRHPSLEILRIKDDFVGTEVTGAFVDLLPTLPALKCIELSIRSFTSEVYQAIVECVSNSSPKPVLKIPVNHPDVCTVPKDPLHSERATTTPHTCTTMITESDEETHIVSPMFVKGDHRGPHREILNQYYKNEETREICSPTRLGGETELGFGDLVNIKQYLYPIPAKDLFNLGLVLGINYIKLNKLKEDHASDFLNDMIAVWLRKEDNVGSTTWKALVKALRQETIGQNGIANKIEANEILRQV